MIDFTRIKSIKIWRLFTDSGCPQGYFLEAEESLAKNYVNIYGGYYRLEYMYVLI